MMYSNIPAAQAVVYHCKARHIENIVISPGSRNAPLTLGFTEDPFFNCYSVVDERSAAFFALGIAQQQQQPVVLVCTSGSALLNYYPAVAEAFYSDIPLVVISADRPAYKIDIGDGQTIRQDRVFDRHIGYSGNLKLDPCHATSEMEDWGALATHGSTENIESAQEEVQSFNDQELNKALGIVAMENCPVHINIPFEEPLYGLQESMNYQPQVELAEVKDSAMPAHFDKLIEHWNNCSKKLIICGVQHPGRIDDVILDTLAKDHSVVVLTETTSNMARPEFNNSIDSILAPVELAENRDDIFEKLRPDLLVTLGGLIVSKKVKAFLRRWKPMYHWHIHENKSYDTFRALTEHLKLHPNIFFGELLKRSKKVNSDYHMIWGDPNTQYKKIRDNYLKKISFSDMSAFDLLFKAIPADYQMQLANSSTVRYSQLFDMNPETAVYCNRGTSGIDGSTSTAIGAALYSVRPTVLISGDLSFLYDINGLWNENIRSDFRIIVINNGGGGIFRILPGHKENGRFEKFFETTHNARFDEICAAYSLDHSVASDLVSLRRALDEFFTNGDRPRLLEIRTPRTLNDKILLRYFEFISSNLYN